MLSQNFSHIEKAILSTLCYYDVFDYPLKAKEIWRWLFFKEGEAVNVSQDEVERILSSSNLLKDFIGTQASFYFLKGRQDTVRLRKERYEADRKKWRIAFSATGFLRMAPFLKFVGVCNNLAINNAKAESDIDFFVITEPGHIWSCRLFVTWFVSMLGYRRHGEKIRDRICLSFYITEDALALESLGIKPHDPYLTFWLDQVVPLYDRSGTYSRFEEKNQWVRRYLPNAFTTENHKLARPGSLGMVQGFFEIFFHNPFIGYSLENYIRSRQLSKMAKNQGSVASQNNTNVIISDSVLKFHEQDRRIEYRDKFEQRLRSVGLL